MTGFTIVWIGQLVSLLGTNMTNFALTIWAFEQTGRATDLALIGFFFMVPLLIVSPMAGAIVDRHDRKLMMMVSDLASGVVTIIVLILYATGLLEVWHLYITAAISGTFQTFQWPAYSAAISTMLPKKQYARANGMISLAESGSGIFAPVLAGAILSFWGLNAVFAIDIITFTVAIGALLVVHIPTPKRTEAGKASQGSLWQESVYGFRYILTKPSLLGLQLLFLGGNFMAAIGGTVFAPMLLARTGSNELIFGSVQSASAIGGVVGGLVMSAWGGPKRLVYGVVGGWVVSGLMQSLFGAGQILPIWLVAGFMMSALVPLINGSNQAIWQAKVAPDVQGRVFAIRRLIAWVSSPVAQLIAGPMADYVMEPAMHEGGQLAGTFGWLVGTGSGAGMGLMMVFSGVMASLVVLVAFSFPAVRHAEALLPDHEQVGELVAGG
ncbi:MAG: MFS transporter [Ardenticatenaceae bacterium]|nr:MFS transporter [Ardenticatenaceae bacterium]MCB8975170.1 MFS transporter [Ardenticatenaceae bacterium]